MNDRLPPHDFAAEQGVLGCILLAPDDCMGECIEKLKPGELVFYDLRHQTLYKSLRAMYDAQLPIDLISVPSALRAGPGVDSVGGVAYLSTLPDQVPSAANLAYYIEIVLEKYTLRKMVQTCTEIVGRVYDDDSNPAGLLKEAENEILAIGDARAGRSEDAVKRALDGVTDEWEWAHNHPGQHTGIDSGLSDLDHLTWGWQREHLIIAAGRPSSGKSALLVGCAAHAAIGLGIPTLIFSLESSAKEIVRRMACQQAKVNHLTMREGDAHEEDFRKLAVAMSAIRKAPLVINDAKRLAIGQIEAITRREVAQRGIKIVFVDYLQKIKADTRHEKRNYEVGQASEGLKAMAERHQIPVVAAAQLNRESDKGKPRQPRLSDLKDSGDIEQDADVAILLHHEKDESFLLVNKIRDGEIKPIPVKFNRQWTRFDNAAQQKITTEDVQRETRYKD